MGCNSSSSSKTYLLMTDFNIKMIKLQDDAEADNNEDQAQDMNDKELRVDLDIKCESTPQEY